MTRVWLGYGHLPIFAGIAGIGGGLFVAADHLGHHTAIGPVTTALSVAAPFTVFTLARPARLLGRLDGRLPRGPRRHRS